MSADFTIKQGQTFPALVTVLYDTTLSTPGKAIDLSTATSVTLAWKGLATALKTGVMTKLTVATPTGTTAIGSNVVTTLSAMTNIVKGSSVIGAGIPAGTIVGDFDSVANTITLTDSLGAAVNATASASGVALTINKGTVSYAWGGAGDTSAPDTYSLEFKIVWPGGTQYIPNSGFRTMVISANLGE